jgi:hypothetical protein
MLFQGCVVYHKGPVSLEQASHEQIKTRIKTVNEQTFTFKYIIQEDGEFYGIQKIRGGWVRVPLKPEEVATAQLKNKTASTGVTLAVVIVPVVILVIFVRESISYDINL